MIIPRFTEEIAQIDHIGAAVKGIFNAEFFTSFCGGHNAGKIIFRFRHSVHIGGAIVKVLHQALGVG